tara:strand:- start:132 stop:1292 length:1161 start_codon:yes stop_codon:yes gene_type:complete
MYEFLLFVIIGILMYLFLNTSNNGFNVGGQGVTRTPFGSSGRPSKRPRNECASMRNTDITFFIFSEDTPTTGLTDLKTILGLSESIISLINSTFSNGGAVYDGYHIVGLYHNKKIPGPIKIGDKTYHLVYYHGILIDFPIRNLNKRLLISTGQDQSTLVPFRPIDITLVFGRNNRYMTALWPIGISDTCPGVSCGGPLNPIIPGELMPRETIKYYVHSICKSMTGFTSDNMGVGTHKYVMDYFASPNFFKNGNNEYINVFELFRQLRRGRSGGLPTDSDDSDEIEFYLNPNTEHTLLRQWLCNNGDCSGYSRCNELYNIDSLDSYIDESMRLKTYYESIGYINTNKLTFSCENWTGSKRRTLPPEINDKYIIFTTPLLKYTLVTPG